jgi:small subunit ribosomal protein S6
MRIYESVFILRPDMPDDEADKFIAQMESVVTSNGGTIQKTDKWGRRRLAYNIRKYREGQYIIITMECEPPVVHEFERLLKVSEPVIKFQTVRIDEELKRLEKRKAHREKRVTKKTPAAAPAAAPPQPPAEPAAV